MVKTPCLFQMNKVSIMIHSQVIIITLIIIENCQKQYGLTPRLSFIFDYFGGKDIKRDFQDATNIIFTNGNLDPWSAGSIITNITIGWGCNALYM